MQAGFLSQCPGVTLCIERTQAVFREQNINSRWTTFYNLSLPWDRREEAERREKRKGGERWRESMRAGWGGERETDHSRISGVVFQKEGRLLTGTLNSLI
jgi:hypothetical protein